MSRDECRKLYYITLLHDCGKCYIPDAVLKKDGKLTDEEYAIIKVIPLRAQRRFMTLLPLITCVMVFYTTMNVMMVAVIRKA